MADAVVNLDTVVVTGSRVEHNSFDLPAAIDVVDAARIGADQARVNASEALAAVPGITVQNRQNYAQDLQISSRGFGARSAFGVRGIRLVSDGIPASMPDGQGQVATFNLDRAERIEVMRGPMSAIYGNHAGGVIQMAEELDEGALSLSEQEGELRRKLYRFSWERAVTGVNVGVSGRPYRDRYVRPGKLQLRYELLEEGQPGAEAIQGTSAQYHLQELIFPIPEGSTESETTRLRAEEVRQELLNGLSFTEAVRGSTNAPGSDGMLAPMTAEKLSRNGGPEMAAFALSARVSEISRPIPVLRGRNILGWRLMKLLDTD
ncbi:MAG: TonB-dependent receptor plug domain-containing protein, partial [Dechloromonas sp.]|nr:TonB-dependent receptor plug domain-containing protein [Dechloromonas sp.]